jgi:hypothetical protein
VDPLEAMFLQWQDRKEGRSVAEGVYVGAGGEVAEDDEAEDVPGGPLGASVLTTALHGGSLKGDTSAPRRASSRRR